MMAERTLGVTNFYSTSKGELRVAARIHPPSMAAILANIACGCTGFASTSKS